MPRKRKSRARQGDGSIFKPKGCQYYYIRWTDPVPHKTRNGRLTRRRVETTGSTDLEVAKQMLRERLSAKRQGRSSPKLGQGTFKDLEQLILLEYDVKGHRSTRRLQTAPARTRDPSASRRSRSPCRRVWRTLPRIRPCSDWPAAQLSRSRRLRHRVRKLPRE